MGSLLCNVVRSFGNIYSFSYTDTIILATLEYVLFKKICNYFSVYSLVTLVKPMVTYFSNFENSLRSDNQSQKNKQPQAFCK